MELDVTTLQQLGLGVFAYLSVRQCEVARFCDW
jgi:hypothetical protein